MSRRRGYYNLTRPCLVGHSVIPHSRNFPPLLLKGKSGQKVSEAQMKKYEKCKTTSHHWPQCANWFSRYRILKSGFCARWTSPFCRFLASFSLKYDVTDAILQDKEKWKCNVSGVFCSICLKFCKLLERSQKFSLDFKFRCYSNQNQNDCLLLKKEKVYCLRKGVSQK